MMSHKTISAVSGDILLYPFQCLCLRRISVTAALVAGMMAAAWGTNYSAWQYYQSITVSPNTGVTAAVTNFPLLVYLTSSNAATVFAQGRSDGFDVRFTTSDGITDLPFQRQSFNSSAQTAEFWVLIPSVAANPATTSIRMYWGNAGAGDVQNPSMTFDTAAGYNYRAVWHMSAAVGSNEPDATQSGHDLVPSNSPALLRAR